MTTAEEFPSLPERVDIREVGPRETFQSMDRVIDTERKVMWIDALAETGVRNINAVSFASSKLIPQFWDSERVMELVRRRPGVHYDATVPTVRGLERAAAVGMDGVRVMLSVTESMNQISVNKSTEDQFAVLDDIIRAGTERGLTVACSLTCSFGCPIEGRVDGKKVVEFVARLVGMGVHLVALGDTAGMGNPRQAYTLCRALLTEVPSVNLGVHFHDNRGTGMANTLAAMAAGVTVIDTSNGGLGGAPGFTPHYSRGISGNISTEDMVAVLDEMGVETGVDLRGMIRCALLAERLLDTQTLGAVTQAGPVEDTWGAGPDFVQVWTDFVARMEKEGPGRR